MENQAVAEPRGQIDRAFLDEVAAEIDRALRQTEELAASFDAAPLTVDDSWEEAFAHMSENLAHWQTRLGDLTQRAATIASDLNDHEQAMRGWFQALGATSARLAQVSAS
jgi:ABC-type transporter Mla subunit MlaD